MVDPIAENEAAENAETPYDAGDPVQVNVARQKSSRRKANRLEFATALMDLPQGRMWIYDLLEFCCVFQTPFVQGHTDATAFNCGKNTVGLRILSDITTAAPDQYLAMIREAKVGNK